MIAGEGWEEELIEGGRLGGSTKKGSMHIRSDLDTCWDVFGIEKKGMCSRKKTSWDKYNFWVIGS